MSDSVLLIDDDVELCHLLREFLEPEAFELRTVHDGSSGLAAALSSEVSLVILDIMLPGINGLDVLRQLRASSRIPVLLLSAKGDEVDRIVGLELGADDYLPKPFNPRELLARMRAILRRSSATPELRESKLAVADVKLDPSRREVTRSGNQVDFTSVEFSILSVLLHSAGKIVKRDDLCRQTLGRVLSPFDRSIDVHVSKIRRKLSCNSTLPDVIKTVRGVGYLYVSTTESNSAS